MLKPLSHRFVFLLLCSSAIPTSALAANIAWLGATSQDWQTPSNWVGGVAPGGSDAAYIDGDPSPIIDGVAVSLGSGSRIGNAGIGALTIQNSGSLASGASTVGNNTGSNGIATINGAGSLWTTGTLNVGAAGSGTLNIWNGGTVASTRGNIASFASSTSLVNVSGAGSQWVNSGTFTVGNSGNATFNVQDQGVIYSTSGTIANLTGSVGLVVVDGVGSQWINTGLVYVGNAGAGTLRIEDGGTVSNTTGIIASGAGSGLVTVTGSGSQWINSSEVRVGVSSTGTLNIQDCGTVSNTTGYIGRNAGATGRVTVTGAGSQWINSGGVILGNAGTSSGVLTVSDGGKVTAATQVQVALAAGSSATVNIGAAAGDTAVAAGDVEAPSIAFGAGTGALVFNHTGTNYQFSADLIGAGTISFLAGTTVLTGDNSDFTGVMNGSADVVLASGTTTVVTNSSGFSGTLGVTGGVLQVNGHLGGSTSVSAGGRVQGNAALDDLTVSSGGTAAPGNSIGTITTANAVFNPGSLYEAEIDGAGQSDRIDAYVTATLNGGTVVVIPYPDFVANQPYTILTAAGGVTGGFDQALDGFQFLDAILSYDANNVYLTLESNGSLLQAARTINQKAVTSGTDAAPAGNAAINELYAMTDVAAVPDALDRLSGEIHASITGALMQGQGDLRRAVLDGAASANVMSDEDSRLWLTGIGSSRETEDTGNTAQFDQRGQGVLAGIEHRGDGWHIGLAAGITTTDLDQAARASEADATSHHVMAYGGTTLPGAVQLTGGVSFSRHDIETQRTIAFAGFRGISESGYGARSTQAFAEFSRDFRPSRHDEELVVTPYLKGTYVVHRSEDFTEDGAAGLAANGTSDDLGTTTLGVRLTEGILVFDDRPVVLSAGAAWRHNFADIDPKREFAFRDADSGFTVRGAPLDAAAVVLTAGFGFRISDTLALNLSYEGVYGEQQSAQGVVGALAWRF